MDLGELTVKRHMSLIAWDVNAGKQMLKLRERIAKGEAQRIRVGSGSVEEGRIRAIDLRLAELRDELRDLELAYDIPTEVIDWAFHLAESLTKRNLPEGSVLQIRIPGCISLEVALDDANEPPF